MRVPSCPNGLASDARSAKTQDQSYLRCLLLGNTVQGREDEAPFSGAPLFDLARVPPWISPKAG
jgi:hypothetical protein